MKRFLASFSCTLVLSAFSLCQVSTSFSTGPHGPHGTMQFQAATYRGPVITGAPYSAEKVHEHVQMLADGTQVPETYPVTKVYRDSMGRTREERPVSMGPVERHPDAPKSPVVVEINDPVAHVRYIFTLDEPVAHRQELQELTDRTRRGGAAPHAEDSGDAAPPPPRTARVVGPEVATPRGADDPSRPQITKEDLGTQIIEGVQVEGKRRTETWPVGAKGNDSPIIHTRETWRSPELKEAILMKVSRSDDPRFGEQTNKLVNISRNEPDASLFEPPAGYTIKDETGEFTIEWGAPAR
jgi:hypothetical protein